MAKTQFEKDLKKESQGHLVHMCDGKGLDHTGDKNALVARLVAFEETKATEPEAETPPAEPEAPAEDPGAETPSPSED